MDTTISDDVHADAGLYSVVKSANDVLIKAIGGAPEPPRAVWRKFSGNGSGQQVELELDYHDVSVSKQFLLAEFNDASELQFRLGRLWEDLLLRANKKTTDRLLEIFREMRREAELQEN